jgi:hypothetical protein
MKNYKVIDFMGTCLSKEIGDLAAKSGKKFSYKKAAKIILDYNPDFIEYFDTKLRNPWAEHTNIKKGNILQVIHSAVDFLFIIKTL